VVGAQLQEPLYGIRVALEILSKARTQVFMRHSSARVANDLCGFGQEPGHITYHKTKGQQAGIAAAESAKLPVLYND
jgi:hypothetical protein